MSSKIALAAAATLAAASFAGSAAAQSINVELGVREQTPAGGQIELIGGQPGNVLNFNSGFQTFSFSFDPAVDPIRPFPVTVGNGVLDETTGTFESLIFTQPMNIPEGEEVTIFVDNITTTNADGTTVLQDFEAADLDSTVFFQRAGFSGSTGTSIVGANTSLVTDAQASQGSQALALTFTVNPDNADPFIRATTFGLSPAVLDLSNASSVTFDIAGIVEVMMDRLPGDANNDGSVTIADFAILRANFGSTDGTFDTGDFNEDGSVTIADFAILRANFGSTVSSAELAEADAWAASIPEPATLGLLAAAGLGLVRRR